MRRVVPLLALGLALAAPAWAEQIEDAALCEKAAGEEAIAACTRALGSDRLSAAERAKLLDARGIALARKGELDRAIADFDQALRLAPDHAQAYSDRGQALARKGEFDRAIADYDGALEIGRLTREEQARVHASRGLAYRSKGELDRAIADYDVALALDPGNAAAYNNRGTALARKGDLEGARRDYRKALELDPNLAQARSNLAALEARLAGAAPVTDNPAEGGAAAREPAPPPVPSAIGAQPGFVEGTLTSGLRSRPFTAEELADPVARSIVEQCERAGGAGCREKDTPETPRRRFVKGVDPRVIALFRLRRLTPGASYEKVCRVLDPFGSVVMTMRSTLTMPAGT